MRPNFVFIYTDDQRYDAMGVVQREQGERARFPWFQTPNMDRIAAEGVRFRNAFVVNSLCSPSRANFLTGHYSHLNGVANNHTPFPTDAVTYAGLLRAAGYTTGYAGKWHHGDQRGQRPGFDYSASFIGQGRYFNCPFEINGVATPTKGWIDDVSTDYALEFLTKNRDKPFLLIVGYKSSHGPWEPPERWKDRYSDAAAKPPVNADARPPFRPANAQPSGQTGGQKRNAQKPGQSGNAPMMRNYFRTLAGVDENLGRLLSALDDLKLADNTMVVFTSDNGYYLGEHGLGDKRSAYEESIRVPLLLRYPKLGVKDKLVDALALNIDLAPTFLDFAGVPVPPAMQGRSWRPLLEAKAGQKGGQDVAWRKSFFYEYFFEHGFFTPTTLAVRTEQAKLIQYPGHEDWMELFDLRADPYEMKNLARDPAHKELLEQMQAEFEQQAKAVDFKVPDYADKPGDEAVRPQRKPALNAFVLSYDFAKDEGGEVVDASGQKSHGTAKGVPLVASRGIRKARRFDGQGRIEVPKTAALDPSGHAWTIEVVLKTEQPNGVMPNGVMPNGVILARGGQSQGYTLYLQDGKPAFSVAANEVVTTVIGQQPITNRWTHLAAVIGEDRRVTLYIDGAAAGSAELPAFIAKDPNEGMQIGADTGTPVTRYQQAGGFVGLIESVRLYSGERKAADIKQDAAAGE